MIPAEERRTIVDAILRAHKHAITGNRDGVEQEVDYIVWLFEQIKRDDRWKSLGDAAAEGFKRGLAGQPRRAINQRWHLDTARRNLIEVLAMYSMLAGEPVEKKQMNLIRQKVDYAAFLIKEVLDGREDPPTTSAERRPNRGRLA